MGTTSESEVHLRVENCWIFLALTSRKIHPACEAQQWLRNDDKHTQESRQQLGRTDNRGLFALDFPVGPPRHFVEGYASLHDDLSRLMCSRVPISYTTHSPFGKIPSSRGKDTKPKGKNLTVAHAHHRRKHQSRQHHGPQGIRLKFKRERDAACQTHPLPTRRKSWTSPCLIHLSNLSCIRLQGEENGVLAPLNKQGSP